jgi:soluble lytic murein transglycosylase
MRKIVIMIFGAITFLVATTFILFNFVLCPTKNENFVVKYSNEYGIEKALVFAIIKTESNFDANAKSSSGAMGLMQIIPSTANWIADELDEKIDDNSLFDEETNIKFGCFYLNYLFSKFKTKNAVICAYNAGEGAVQKWLDENGEVVLSKIDYSETLNYLKKVNGYYSIYKSHELCF